MASQKCKHCGYKWEARVADPKTCPRCKYRMDYDWNKKKVGK